MRIKIQLITLFTLFIHAISAQSLNRTEIWQLFSCIDSSILHQKNLQNRTSPSEYIICLLDMDSAGKVSRIHLLADESNRDSIYSYLHRMTPASFKNFRADSCKRKTIMLPIISSSNDPDPEYIANLKTFYLTKEVGIENDTKTMVMLSPLHYYLPLSSLRFVNGAER